MSTCGTRKLAGSKATAKQHTYAFIGSLQTCLDMPVPRTRVEGTTCYHTWRIVVCRRSADCRAGACLNKLAIPALAPLVGAGLRTLRALVMPLHRSHVLWKLWTKDGHNKRTDQRQARALRLS